MRWGALAKVKAMDHEYGDLFLVTSGPTVSRMRETRTTVTATGTSAEELLDLAAVMKASHAISGEIVLKPLLDTLMKIVIEIAGAEKGFLIRKANGELVIEAQSDQSQDRDRKQPMRKWSTRLCSLPCGRSSDRAAGYRGDSHER